MTAHRPEKVRAWRALVEAWKRSGQTVNAFCRARQLTRSNIAARSSARSVPTVPGLPRVVRSRSRWHDAASRVFNSASESTRGTGAGKFDRAYSTRRST